MTQPLLEAPVAHRRTFWICCGLIALTVAVYGPIVHHDFIEFDDDKLIRDNPAFNPVRWDAVVRYWRGPYYGGAFPVAYTIFAAIASVAHDAQGMIHARAFHVASLLLHAGCVLIVFATLRRLVRSDWASAAGAVLFAVHPLQVESVAWATNINSLVQSLFSLAAVYLYVVYAQRDAGEQHDGRQRWLFAGATACLVLAMASKPVAVTLPLVAFALDVGWIGRPARRAIVPAGIWLALAAPFVIVTRVMLESADVFVPPLWARPLVALDALAFYLGKILLPLGSSPDYGRSPRWLMGSAALYATWIVPVVVAVAMWQMRKRAPELLSATFVFVASLLPVLGLTPFHQQQYSTVTDRYLYVPMLALAAAVAWIVSRHRNRAIVYATAAWLVVLAVWCRAEVGKWRDTETLFRTTVARNPTSLAGHTVLGLLAAHRRQYDVAMTEYRAALRTDPGFPPTLYNLGNALLALRRFDEAIDAYRSALVRDPNNARYLNNLGVALAEAGRSQEADECFSAVLRNNPKNVDALIGHGVVSRQLGSYAASIEAFEQALSIDPKSQLARRGIEQTHAAMGNALASPTTSSHRDDGTSPAR